MNNIRKKRLLVMPFLAVFIAVEIFMVSCKKEEGVPSSTTGDNPPASIVEGTLSGTFSIGNNRHVYFSQGNLQYTTTGTHAVAGGGTAPGTWRFAEHQWDAIGVANSNTSSSYSGWIDLFGWGTSGYHNSGDQYNTNYQPYSTNTSTINTNYNYYGYGPSTNMTDPNLTGTSAYYDWGVYNAISNGGNQPGLWRTLTRAEWDTIINIRATASGIRFAKAKVNGVPGVIIVPDNWSDSYALNSYNTAGADYTSNVISSAQWATLENAGCAFLSAAGVRNGSTVYGVVTYSGYWSATYSGSYYSGGAYDLDLSSDRLGTRPDDRYIGLSVRLVRPAE